MNNPANKSAGQGARIATLAAALCLLPGLVLAAGSAEMEVGESLVNVPLPEGFVELTPEMSPYYETSRAYIAESNLRFLTLVPEDTAEILLRGEVVDLPRYINIESEKALSARSVSAAFFAQLQDIVRTQIDDLYVNAEQQIAQTVADGNKKLSEEFGAELAVELGGMVPLPIHLDTDNAMAHSMFMTVGSSVDGEQSESKVLASTTLFLHAKDKVLFLYVYGPESELDWTRETAASLGENIVAANPLSAEEMSSIEAADSSGIDWGKVAKTALIGGLLGGIFSLVGFFSRRRKQANGESSD